MNASLHVRDLGRTRYDDVHALQEELVAARIADEIGDTLLLTEHERVVTLGRGSPKGAEGDVGLPVVAVERGGEATWHGPGQLVAYPIVRLDDGPAAHPARRRDLHLYLRELEAVVIDVLADLGVGGARVEGKTGVWIGAQKVCSIGVAVRRWVTWHGLALNVDNDLDDFRKFRPCGLEPGVMTRLADHARPAPSMDDVRARLVDRFRLRFGYELPRND